MVTFNRAVLYDIDAHVFFVVTLKDLENEASVVATFVRRPETLTLRKRNMDCSLKVGSVTKFIRPFAVVDDSKLKKKMCSVLPETLICLFL